MQFSAAFFERDASVLFFRVQGVGIASPRWLAVVVVAVWTGGGFVRSSTTALAIKSPVAIVAIARWLVVVVHLIPAYAASASHESGEEGRVQPERSLTLSSDPVQVG